MNRTRRQFLKVVAAAAILPAAGSSGRAFTVNQRNMWPHELTSAETLARCDRVLAANPHDVLCLCHRGQVSPFVRVETLAEADLTRVICLEPDNPALYYVRGVTLNRAADLMHAIGLLKAGGDIGGTAFCTSEPDIYRWRGADDGQLFYKAHRELGSILEEAGRFDEALAAFQRAASFRVISQADLERWSESDMQVGRLAEAYIGYKTLSEIEPKVEYRQCLEECKRWLRGPRSVWWANKS